MELFCRIKNKLDFGLGKIIQFKDSTSVVEFFDSPTNIVGRRISVPISTVSQIRLGKNTRVFIYDEISNQWRIGRVREDDGEGVEVRLAHKKDIYFSYNKVFVRWKRPIDDPVEFLGNFITETPQYAEARSGFIRSYIRQRGAAFGISALLSSAIELEPHQVDVVRRILTDHTQRYLLADEVGLGKTIEAGVIVRQTVLDDMRGHRVLILVPRELVAQWREELTVRFGLLDFLDESVFVLPQEDSDELRQASKKLSLLVIDEAHHLTVSSEDSYVNNLYQFVTEISRNAERLLLLSATPILRNESGFLRMLNLLDPVVYPLEDLDGFRLKVSNRQALAESVAGLDPSNALFMDSILDDLMDRLPSDSLLTELSLALKERLLDLPDEKDLDFCASVRQLRAHVSETYRLNRRILRNRRTQVDGLTPERKGAVLWRVESSKIDRVENALEDWRVEAILRSGDSGEQVFSELGDFYWKVVRSIIANPAGILLLCADRQRLIENSSSKSFCREEQLLQNLYKSVDFDDWINSRLERLLHGLVSLSDGIKSVVFCSDEDIANRVFDFLKNSKINSVRHSAGSEDEVSGVDTWRAFLEVPEVRAIICGPSAEEGINLQGGKKAIIHFDLPLQPNRVEQRIGRVDRYGAGNAVPSYVLVDDNAPLQMAWFRILDEGLEVFSRSISSLQYLVDGVITTLSATLVHDGVEGFDSLRDRLAGPSGEVSRELRLIDQQDALDQLSPLPVQELDTLFDADAEWKEIRDAMSYWIEETLLFDKVKLSRPNGSPSLDDPFRFHYCSPEFGTGKATLIPLTEFIEEFLGAIDFDAPGNRSARPQSYPYVTHRATSVKRNVRPLRYGTEFVEAIRSFSEIDVRGRSFSIWRQFPNDCSLKEMRTCFRFDLVVETDLVEVLGVLALTNSKSLESSRSSLARRGDTLFPPTVIQVWLDADGEELPVDFVKSYLDLKYSKEGNGTYVDKNLDASYLAAIRSWSPDTLINWANRCESMRDKAKAIVLAGPELIKRQEESLSRALAGDEVRYAQLRTRIQSLEAREAIAESEQLSLEQSLNEALRRGISLPAIKVDVAGVVFLTCESISVLENHLAERV
jgi:ATP-dependent helicase HepA